MNTAARIGLLGLGLFAVTGCASNKPIIRPGFDWPVLTGRVIGPAVAAAVPSDAVLTVRLLDVTKTDEPPVVLADKSISNPGPFPITFALPYPPGSLKPEHRVVMDARIDVAGKTRFYSTTLRRVEPAGGNQPSTVTVEQVGD